MAAAQRFLFTHWEGGGNTPPMLAVARRLLDRGHAVRILSDPCNRGDVEGIGAEFREWTRAPRRLDKSADTDPLRDWEVKSPPVLMGRLRDRMFVGPSLGYAHDVLAELRRAPASVVVTSEMLLGAMAGAEAAGTPCVGLSANVYLFPLPGVPPFGPGFPPATNAATRAREWIVRTMTLRVFGKGAETFNRTRRELGLEPVRHPFDQLTRLARHLVLTSAAFDFPSTAKPERVIYAGPELGDPAWTAPWSSPWSASDRRPLVLVGFSTTFQNQRDALCRVVEALGSLDIRAVVTTGPAIDVASLPSRPNVHVCVSAPHTQLLQDAAAVVTHAGHGTVIRALAAGVPVVCLPMGRDQNDNAARVVHRGVGRRLSPHASSARIAAGVRDVIDSPAFRDRARALGARILADARASRAVPVLEAVAASSDNPSIRWTRTG